MVQSLYTGASGLYSHQRNLDVISNNMANMNTVGFKKGRTEFKDALYSEFQDVVPGEVDENMQYGNGVRIAQISKIFTEAPMQGTGNPLDVAIVGDGYFSYVAPNGETRYTRDGAFALSQRVDEGDNVYLTTNQGYYVLDAQGQPIMLPQDTDDVSIRANGMVYQGNEYVATIGLFGFPNQGGLSSVGSNGYVPTEASGEAQLMDRVNVQQGFLEASNVDMAEEMTRMIRAQRAFQMASRVVKTADEMEQIANNLRA